MTVVAAESGPTVLEGAVVRAYIAGAQRRERSARHLAGRRDWVGALRLYSEAAALLLRGHWAIGGHVIGGHVISGHDGSCEELAPQQLLEGVLALARREGWTVPPELQRLSAPLGALEWDAFDRLDEQHGERLSDDFDAAVRFLVGKFPEVERAEHRRELRWFAAGATLLALSALGALLWSVTRPPNLALKRPVSASPAGYETAAEEAVNGIRFGEIGYHSGTNSPWLQVDLEAERTVRRIEIYGRGDCCFDQSIPLAIEGSRDGVTYDVLGRLDRPFQPFRPSVVRLESTSIRYVRLRSPKRSSLVVAELEVY